MLENIQASAPVKTGVFTVIWQGILYDDPEPGADTDAETAVDYCTEVIPEQYGYLAESLDRGDWAKLAEAEEFDGESHYHELHVLFVLEGGSIPLELE